MKVWPIVPWALFFELLEFHSHKQQIFLQYLLFNSIVYLLNQEPIQELFELFFSEVFSSFLLLASMRAEATSIICSKII